MLFETTVFNMYSVEDHALCDIKNLCLEHFAERLEEVLTSGNEKIRKFWVEPGSTANYKFFQDWYGSKITYNTKNIVFEETITNNESQIWSVRDFCADYFNLELAPEAGEGSSYYQSKANSNSIVRNCCCGESYVGTRRPKNEADKAILNFYKSFGVGEFPFIVITVLRIGNKDHFFYRITR